MGRLKDSLSWLLKRPGPASHPSGSEQPRASGDSTLLNLPTHPRTEHSRPSSYSSSINDRRPAPQFANVGGTQNTSTGSGNQFPGANFNAPVHFGHNPLDKEEEKKKEQCHQLFRLTGASYEWYKNRVEDRVKDTCQWFLNHKHFQTWLGQDSGPLLVSADPGCGKSVLAKYLIDEGLPRSATICYFFFKDQDQNTIRQALCALLHQLFSHQPSLIRHAMPEYSKNGQGLISNTTLLWGVVESALRDPEIQPLIIVLDALDECVESDFRDLIRMLKRQFHKGKQDHIKVKWLVTCRPYERIVSEFHELVNAFPYIRIPGEDESETISQEVNRVIRCRVEQLATEKRLSEDIKGHLTERLLEIPHRTYLWVYLVFDYLKTSDFKKTEKGINSSIAALPADVSQAYEKILSKSKDDQMVRKALGVILAASRPLTLTEMNFAVNIDSSLQSMGDLDLEEEEDFRSRLRSWCGLFISIYHGKVYFLHQTAREFLLADLLSPTTVPQGLQWQHAFTITQAHAILAEVCVVYLDFFNSDANKEASQHAFLDYSAKHWGSHFREACIPNDAAILPPALRICNPDSKSYSAWFKTYWQTTGLVTPEHFTDLMVASYFGHGVVVRRLLEMGKVDPQAKDNEGRTPLLWAARNGHEAVVRLLLDGGADPNSQSVRSRTPLLYAAERGREAVVTVLLEKGADPNSKDDNSRTPLLHAAERGHKAVVERLLMKTGINAQDKIGATALHWVAVRGHGEVMSLLLKSGADIETKERGGGTPLAWAIESGFTTGIKALLAKDCEVNYWYKPLRYVRADANVVSGPKPC